MSTSAEPKFRVSPSRIARFFFHECERYLRYRTATAAQRKIDDIPAIEPDRSVLTQRILEGGVAWEEQLLRDYLKERAIVANGPTEQPIHERRHDYISTIAMLATAKPGVAIYQPTVEARPTFYEAYGLDPALVRFVDCHPDLLLIEELDDGSRTLVVVDAKASDLMKLSHRIQVALYAILLEHALADAGVDLPVSRQGAVWLYGQPEPERFDLSTVRPPLELFLANELTPLLEGPASGAFWHLYFRCEWCDYFGHCRREAEQTSDVSLVPYLSTFAKRHLHTRANVRTLTDLSAALDGPEAEQILAGCASLEGRAHRLRRALDAIDQDKVLPTDAGSVGMPVGEHVRVTLTVQSEPLTGQLYGFAVNRLMGKEVYGDGSSTVVDVAVSNDPRELARLRRSLVDALMETLRPVHDHNSATDEWLQQKALQCYVFDSYERELLVQTLLEEVASGVDPKAALALLFHFQHPDLVVAENHPADEVFFPLIVLTDVVRQVVALPVHVVYRLADVNAALQPKAYGFKYSHNDFHSFEYSNRMKSNAIFEVWHRDRDDLLNGIRHELQARVWSASSVIDGLRQRLKDTDALFAWPPKFLLPEGLDLQHELLSRLVFITRYEAVLRYLEIRSRRALSVADRMLGERSLLLTTRGDGCFALDRRQFDAEIETSNFPDWILTIDNDAGRRARVAFDDFPYRSRMYGPKNKPLALAAVVARPTPDELFLDLRPTPAFTAPLNDQRCTLDQRFTDWNTGRLIGDLVALDTQTEPWLVRLLTDPAGTRQTIKMPAAQRAVLEQLAITYAMTPSQLDAFRGARP